MGMKREDETQTEYAMRLLREEAYVTALDRVRSLLASGYGDAWDCIRRAERDLGIEIRP